MGRSGKATAVETDGSKLTNSDIAEAEKKVVEAKADVAVAKAEVAVAKAKVAEAKAQLLKHDKGDEEWRSIRANAIKEHGILLDYLRATVTHLNSCESYLATAVSHLISLQNRLNRFAELELFDKMNAQSPTAKQLHSAIASVAPAVWSFYYPKKELTQKDRPALRETTAKHYHIWMRNGMAQCQLSRVYGDKDQVTVNHLLPHSTKHHNRKMFGIEDINDKRNLLLLSKGLESAFKSGQIYFESRNDRAFIMKIFDNSVKTHPIFAGSTKTIGSLEGKKLMIPSDVEPPFKRVLNHHAQSAYRNALQKKFITKERKPPTEYGSPLKDNILSITQTTTESLMDESQES